MLSFSEGISGQLNSRDGLKMRFLYWVTARTLDTGDAVNLGLWNGDDVQTFSINGDARTYAGAGGVLTIDDLTTDATLAVRSLAVGLSEIAPEVAQLLRGYDTRFAPIEIHLVWFDPIMDTIIDDPYRIYKGWIGDATITTPVKGDQGSASTSNVSHTRMLTRKLAAKRSNDNQVKRDASDTFFANVAITGTVLTGWGSVLVTTAASK